MIKPLPPLQTHDKISKILLDAGVEHPVSLLGMRAKDNERGMYDDAIFVCTPDSFQAFNANCDPSHFEKGVASLKKGLWFYKMGIHGLSKPVEKRYKALVQAQKVTVLRDQGGEDTGFFGINIHRGSYNSTSSEGCQTIYPDQWDAFINLVQAEMDKWGQPFIPYLLVEGA